MDAEETLAESNKNGNMEKRIRGQLMQMNPVDEQETTEELMDRSGKTANEKVNECYPESDGGMLEAFIARKPQGLLLLQ
jgi:SOS response regulatory protein OraA/RecX